MDTDSFAHFISLFSLLAGIVFFAIGALAVGRFTSFSNSIQKRRGTSGEGAGDNLECGLCIFWDDEVAKLCDERPELAESRKRAVVALTATAAIPVLYGFIVMLFMFLATNGFER